MRRSSIQPITGFFTVAVLGTAAHFIYEWSGNSVWVGAFCAVNESTWEHMKLLFFPALLFTLLQTVLLGEDILLPAVRAAAVTAGLLLIPTLYYTYSGILGFRVLWADLAVFYLSDAAIFLTEARLRRRSRLRKPEPQPLGLLWLWALAFLFVWWTFRPPRIGLFLDPLTGRYGI